MIMSLLPSVRLFDTAVTVIQDYTEIPLRENQDEFHSRRKTSYYMYTDIQFSVSINLV